MNQPEADNGRFVLPDKSEPDSYPRPKMEQLILDIIEETGPLTTREIAQELYNRRKAYTVIDGNESPVSIRGLEAKLNSFWNINKRRDNKWEKRE